MRREIDATDVAVARAYYEANEWSGCAGSSWEKLPAEAQLVLGRQAQDWRDAVQQAS